MAYHRVEVLTGEPRRRRYRSEEKVRLVEEAFQPGVVVRDAARRLGVHESLLYRWRQELSALGLGALGPGFMPVTVVTEPSTMNGDDASECAGAPTVPPMPPAPVVEVMMAGGACVRLTGSVDPALAVTVLRTMAGLGIGSGRRPS
jgi:transposase